MPTAEIEEFAKLLVRQVRDQSVRNCDIILRPQVRVAVALRWKKLAASPAELGVMVPDVVDQTVFCVLQAIDQGTIRLKFMSSSGREVDLTEEGLGELSGWYMGSGGWRSMYSEERFVDDFVDLRS